MSWPACVFLLTARWRSSSCNSLHAAVIHCTWSLRSILLRQRVCFFWPHDGPTCTCVATKVVSGMMFFFSDPWCNRRWCFFWPIGAASAFCIAIFLQSAQHWRRFGSTTLNEACVFSGRASDSAACAKVVPGIIVFFSDPSYDRLSPKENNAVGASAAVVFLHGKKARRSRR